MSATIFGVAGETNIFYYKNDITKEAFLLYILHVLSK